MKQSIRSFFEQSQYHMANIEHKSPNFRRAIATGRVYIGKSAFKLVKEKKLPKGDALNLAEIAGIQGAKMAWQHIPMCHPLLIDHIAVYPTHNEKEFSIDVFSTVSAIAKTGVEMEALAAVNAALLTLYDLIKPVEPALIISDVRLLLKEGGKKGLWRHPDGLPNALQEIFSIQFEKPLENKTAAIITLSDRAYKGEYQDRSGLILKGELENMGCQIIDYSILPDEPVELEQKLTALTQKTDLILTTGGTGIAPRDQTPETLLKLSDMNIPGIGELLRHHGALKTPYSYLSRSMAITVNNTLIIALPGSINGVKDSINILKHILPHALDHLSGKQNIHGKQHD